MDEQDLREIEATLGEITEVDKLIGQCFVAKSFSEVQSYLQQYTHVQDSDILKRITQMGVEVKGSNLDSRKVMYDLIMRSLIGPMLTYEGPGKERWVETGRLIGENLVAVYNPLAEVDADQRLLKYLVGVYLGDNYRDENENLRRARELLIQADVSETPLTTRRYIKNTRALVCELMEERDLGDLTSEIIDAYKGVLSIEEDGYTYFKLAETLYRQEEEENREEAIAHYKKANGFEEFAEYSEARATSWWHMAELLTKREKRSAEEEYDAFNRAWALRDDLASLGQWKLGSEFGGSLAHHAPNPTDPQFDRAIQMVNGAIKIATETGIDEIVLVPSYGTLGKFLSARGHPVEAERSYQRAVDIWDANRHRPEILGDVNVVDEVRPLYRNYVDFMLDKPDPQAAFELTFGIRTHLFGTLLGYRTLPPSSVIPASLWQQASDAFERLDGARGSLEEPNLQREHDQLFDELVQLDSVASKIFDLQPLTIEDIASRVSPGTALVSIFPSYRRVVAFLLKRSGEAPGAFEHVTLSEHSIADVVNVVLDWIVDYEEFRYEGLPTPERIAEIASNLDQCLDMLIEILNLDKLVERLDGIEKVVINAFYPFSFIPLQAFPLNDGQFLCDRFDISFLPSLRFATIPPLERVSAGQRMLIVSDPRPNGPEALPYASIESAVVRRLFANGTPQILNGDQAGRANVLAALTQADYAHLACHGHHSFKSIGTLRLAGIDELSFAELVKAAITTQLLVLSSCESGLTTALHYGDEFLSIPSALLAAGASAVLTSLWQVEDRATMILMYRFYHHLVQEQYPPPRALRKAQLWLREADGPAIAEVCETLLELAATSAPHTGATTKLKFWLERLKKRPGYRPYSQRFYWAPFYLMGS